MRCHILGDAIVCTSYWLLCTRHAFFSSYIVSAKVWTARRRVRVVSVILCANQGDAVLLLFVCLSHEASGSVCMCFFSLVVVLVCSRTHTWFKETVWGLIVHMLNAPRWPELFFSNLDSCVFFGVRARGLPTLRRSCFPKPSRAFYLS